MIQETRTYPCPHCASRNIVKNGYNAHGKQCGKCGVLNATERYSAAQKEQILNAYYERPSMRGIERIFRVACQTLASWLKKALSLPSLVNTLIPAEPTDRLELDEMWSFVETPEQAVALAGLMSADSPDCRFCPG